MSRKIQAARAKLSSAQKAVGADLSAMIAVNPQMSISEVMAAWRAKHGGRA